MYAIVTAKEAAVNDKPHTCTYHLIKMELIKNTLRSHYPRACTDIAWFLIRSKRIFAALAILRKEKKTSNQKDETLLILNSIRRSRTHRPQQRVHSFVFICEIDKQRAV